MRFSINIFCTDETISPRDAAEAGEQAGFPALFFPDHTHVPTSRRTPWPGGVELPREYSRIYDPLIAIQSAADATSSIRLGVGVCAIPLRDPILLARQTATVDVLSGGRLILGVGAGWNLEEIANHGVDPRTRWAVMRERILAIREIWTTDASEFHGEYVDFDPIWSWPKPLQKPHPPIIVGGHGKSVIDRVLEYGDGWMPMPSPGGPPLGERIAELRERAAAVGRDRIPVWVQVYGDQPERRVIERYADADVDEIILQLPAAPAPEVLRVLGMHARLADEYSADPAR